MKETAEKNQSLWLLTVSPVIWAAHLMLCYVTASIWCAKLKGTDSTFQSVLWAIIAFTGWMGYRAHRLGGADAPHDDDTPEDRHRFMGYATLLLSGLSGVAVIYAALVAIFIETCQ